jgi:hypothetical protein
MSLKYTTAQMEMKAQMERMYTHRGRGCAGIFFSGGRLSVCSGGRTAAGGAEYPHEGQPPEKAFSSPVKPQEGQRTDAKNLPQCGQALVSRSTS